MQSYTPFIWADDKRPSICLTACLFFVFYDVVPRCGLCSLLGTNIASLIMQQPLVSVPMLVHNLQELGAVKWLTQTDIECASGLVRHCGYD